MGKGQEQALKVTTVGLRTHDSPLSPEREHRSRAIWRSSPGPGHKGLGSAFAQSCACLAPGDGELGPSSMLGVGGVLWPQLGEGGSQGGRGGAPRLGGSASFLAPGSYLGSRSGGSCRGPPQTPATSSSRSHLVCSCAHPGLQPCLCLLQVADLLVRTATFSPRL